MDLDKILAALSLAGDVPPSLLVKIFQQLPLAQRVRRELPLVTGPTPDYAVAVAWLQDAQPFIASLTKDEFAFIKKAASLYSGKK